MARRGYRPGSAGLRFARVPRRLPDDARGILGPTPRYAVIPRWGLVERFDTADLEQQAEPRRGPSLGGAPRHPGRDDRRARHRRAGAHRAVRAADHQPQRAVESGGGVVGHLARRRRQRGRPLPGVRDPRAADELVDRPPIGGLQTRWAPRTPTAVGAARRLPCAVREPGVGAGLRPRTGQRRRLPRPAPSAHRGVVGACGCSARRCRCSPSRPASPPTPRASPTTPSRRSSPT